MSQNYFAFLVNLRKLFINSYLKVTNKLRVSFSSLFILFFACKSVSILANFDIMIHIVYHRKCQKYRDMIFFVISPIHPHSPESKTLSSRYQGSPSKIPNIAHDNERRLLILRSASVIYGTVPVHVLGLGKKKKKYRCIPNNKNTAKRLNLMLVLTVTMS